MRCETVTASSPQRLDDLGDVLTVRQVAGVLQLAENTVYEAIRRGDIHSLRLGRRVLIPKAMLLRVLEGEDAEGRTLGDGARDCGMNRTGARPRGRLGK
jgi:excisionase family DNA binding protein